jgi:hypothetical protein
VKILLTIFFLIFTYPVFSDKWGTKGDEHSHPPYSESKIEGIIDRCNNLASKATVDYGFKRMKSACYKDNVILHTNITNRSVIYKCWKKAYKQKTESAIKVKFKKCYKKNK